MSANNSDDWDDFEYELEEAAPSKLCAHCGSMLSANGQCPKCGNLIETLDQKFAGDVKEVREIYGNEAGEDVELDEYGMPVDPAHRRNVDYLEMEELGDHELPAAFYAIAFVVLLVFSLLAIAVNNFGLACLGAGLLLTVGGVLGMITGYVALKPKYGGLGTTLWMPFSGLMATFFPGSVESAPQDKGANVGKWSLLSLLVGVVCLVIYAVLGVGGVEW